MADADTLDLELIPSEERDLDSDTASYKIKTYGTDFTLEILSSKLDEHEIVIPAFQRRYVWPPKKASKLVESFLLGLPVPQIFLYRHEETQDLMVVDGQQRLRSVNYFLRGEYEDKTPFRLTSVKERWEGKTYNTLTEQDKRKFKNSILRATIFEQTDPKDNSSVFEIFERLNTGGMALTPQEIRNCVIRGGINPFVEELNLHKSWRALLGKPTPDSRMKDVELILRFFALSEGWTTYKKPMKDFITEFMEEKKNPEKGETNALSQKFKGTTDFIFESLGVKAFRLKTGINVALMDSLMVAVSEVGPQKIKDSVRSYESLLTDRAFLEGISESTTNVERVQGRIKIARAKFAE